MKNITNILITAIIAIMPLVAKGEIQYNKLFDGSYYSIDTENKTATLTYGKDAQYVNIPEKITVDDVEYTVTTIGGGAFGNGYSLKTLVIPATVTNIKKGSTYKTFPSSMTNLYLLTPNAEIEKNAFQGRNEYTFIVNTVPGHIYTKDSFSYPTWDPLPITIKIGTYTFDADGMIQMTEVTETKDAVEFTDDENFTNNVVYMTTKATYTRKNVTAGNWCSLCLPFDCEVPNGTTVYEFVEMKSDAVVVSEVEKITAGIPYVFKNETGGDVTFSAENALIKTWTDFYDNVSTVTKGNVLFVGALQGYSFIDTPESKEKFPHVWGINTLYTIDPADNTFKKLNTFAGNTDLKSVCYPYHVFIQLEKNSSGASELKITNGGTTAIDSMKAEKDKGQAVYNLNGQRMAAPRKGINIINGKKVIIK